MLKIEGKKNKKLSNDLKSCYNCGVKIIDRKQKYCPNCQVILNPNAYINWKKSWYGFLCCLCIIPFLIALFIIFFL
ncbi:MAG: hypothetical protein ACFE9Q_11725 [Candidatus Hodarchaeota archaeon]